MHTGLEIQVSTVENLAQSDVLHLRPGIGQNVAMHALPIAINDKLLSLCLLSLCPNYCLYTVTVGVADGGVADTVNILHLSLSSFCLSAHLHFFWRWLCVVDIKIKTQELTTFLFILPVAVCHSFSPPPPPFFFFFFSIVHCRVVLCINLHQSWVSNWTIMSANPQGRLRIMHQRRGGGRGVE